MSEDLQSLQSEEIQSEVLHEQLKKLLAEKIGADPNEPLDTLLSKFASPELSDFDKADKDEKNRILNEAIEAQEQGEATEGQVFIVSVANHAADLVQEQNKTGIDLSKVDAETEHPAKLSELDILLKQREEIANKAGYDNEAKAQLDEIDKEIEFLKDKEPQTEEQQADKNNTEQLPEQSVQDDIHSSSEVLNDNPPELENSKPNKPQPGYFSAENTDDRILNNLSNNEAELADIETKLSDPSVDDNEKQELDARKNELLQHLEFLRTRQADKETPVDQNAEQSNSNDIESVEAELTDQELADKLQLATLRLADTALLIREAAERDLMVNVNSGSKLRRFGRKMFKLNPMVREAWLQKRQAQLESQIAGKSIEELYDVLSSLDSEAKDGATKELILALLDESSKARNSDENEARKVGTGDEALDAEIRNKIKEITSEYLSIASPSPDDKARFDEQIATYMQEVSKSHPDLVGSELGNNFMGINGAELLEQVEKLKNQLEKTMEHDDAMDRVNASLDQLELVFGEMQAGANGELAHTKFNDTMERLRSKDTRLGSLLRKHRGFAGGCAAAFFVGIVASRSSLNTAARVIGIGSFGISGKKAGYH